MVSNYVPDSCKYKLSRLDDVVFLIEASDVGRIIIDSGECYLSSAVGTSAVHLPCHNLVLNESETLDERYAFTHSITFRCDGYKNLQDITNHYYVILKDLEGNYWIMNPRTQAQFTYTYTLGAGQDITDFTISTISNYPLMRVMDFNPYSIHYKWVDVTSPTSYICDDCSSETGGTFHPVPTPSPSMPYDALICKSYTLNSIDSLMLNESNYSSITFSGITYTNDGFKEVKYNKDSCVLTETFDGTNVSHQVTFTISLDDYKSSWHYNLLEFAENKYAAVVKTSASNLCVGFKHGLHPRFDITGSNSESNLINITLTDLHDEQYLIRYLPLEFNYSSASTWQWVTSEYECVSTSMAKHLLQEKYDLFGNPLDLYKCLEGYQIDYEYLGDKLVGEFPDTEDIYYYSNACSTTECNVQCTIPNIISFIESGDTYTYSITCDGDWSLTSSNTAITVSPTSGDANVEYNVTITNNVEPTTSVQSHTITLNYCDMVQTYTAKIEAQTPTQCFPYGDTYYVPCSGGTLQIPTACCVQSFVANKPISNKQIQSGYISMYVEPYDCTTITLTLTMCDGGTETLYVNPNGVFSTSSGTPYCLAFDKYIDEYVNVTFDSGSTYQIVSTTSILVEQNSAYCGYIPPTGPRYRWTNSGTTCVGYDKYNLQVYEVSYDSGATWSAVTPTETQTGSLIEANSEDCGYVHDYSKDYLTFKAVEDCKFKFTNNVNYSLDGGKTWAALPVNTYTQIIYKGNTIMWKSDAASHGSQYGQKLGTFSSTNNFIVQGNIMSLLYNDSFINKNSLNRFNNIFVSLFSGCSITTAENLILPATTLATYCYQTMFQGCTLLTTAPQLPSTTLNQGCYLGMFSGCTSLIESPVLSAATLADSCYMRMFEGCSNLDKVTCLATDITAHSSTRYWLKNVASTGTFTKASSMTSWGSGEDGIPTNWTIIDNA